MFGLNCVPRSNHRRQTNSEVRSTIGILIWIIGGAMAGFVAGKMLTGKGLGLFWDIVVGILGAFLGGWLAGIVGIPVDTGTLTVTGLVAAFLGAVILLLVFGAVTSRRIASRVETTFRHSRPCGSYPPRGHLLVLGCAGAGVPRRLTRHGARFESICASKLRTPSDSGRTSRANHAFEPDCSVSLLGARP